MKKILLSLFLVLFTVIGMAQSTRDVVKLKNGSVIKGTVLEMIPNQSIKVATVDGSVFVYDMNDIQEVQKEEVSETNLSSVSNDDLCNKGVLDAGANYHGEGSLRGATWATTLIVSPLFGLIPAAIGASTEPTQIQMNCPEPKLYQENIEYRNCYKSTAQNIKKNKSWGALGASSCVWLGLVVVLCVL